jgi:hypothetical protein
MKRLREQALGFDARVTAPYSNWSDPTERAAFQFRSDVKEPYSLDPEVWPSVFDSPRAARPRSVGYYQDLWMSLDALRSCLDASGLPPAEYVIVCAVAFESTSNSAFKALRWAGPREPTPPDRSSGWPFLGYDVCDVWGYSGLCNRRFTDDESSKITEWRGTWGPLLNQHHLFGLDEDAWRFSEFCDRRASRRAPSRSPSHSF